jgi:hypothetical protein
MQPVSAMPWNTAGPIVSNPGYPDTVPLATAATPPTAVDADVRHKRVAPGEPHAVGLDVAVHDDRGARVGQRVHYLRGDAHGVGNGQLVHAHHGIRPVWRR